MISSNKCNSKSNKCTFINTNQNAYKMNCYPTTSTPSLRPWALRIFQSSKRSTLVIAGDLMKTTQQWVLPFRIMLPSCHSLISKLSRSSLATILDYLRLRKLLELTNHRTEKIQTTQIKEIIVCWNWNLEIDAMKI